MRREPLRQALLELDAALAAAGERAVALLERAVALLDDPDDTAAHHVLAGAGAAQETHERIENAIERLMALQAPLARDLRRSQLPHHALETADARMKLAHDMENTHAVIQMIGDLTERAPRRAN